jgi:hypothetical protein
MEAELLGHVRIQRIRSGHFDRPRVEIAPYREGEQAQAHAARQPSRQIACQPHPMQSGDSSAFELQIHHRSIRR